MATNSLITGIDDDDDGYSLFKGGNENDSVDLKRTIYDNVNDDNDGDDT